MWDTIAQIGIAIFGVTAILLVAKKSKWGFVFGLISQPFWYITSYLNGQWGVFFLSIVYSFSWAFGIYQWFYRDNKGKKTK
jgi:nicotinamide riboside transporter PnuC